MPHQPLTELSHCLSVQQQQHQTSEPQHSPSEALTADVTQLSASLPQHGDDALIQGLLPWINSTAMLAKLAVIVAVQACCQQDTRQDQGQPHADIAQSPGTASSEQQEPVHSQARQAHIALSKVINALGMSEADCSPPVLPALKRRNSGKRNLHKPWTSTEEEQLVKLVDQADYRKEVLNVHRLTSGAWAKIGHHLGRSGASGVQAIKAKYRSLKLQTAPQPAAVPSSVLLETNAQQLANGTEASPAVLSSKGEKRSKLTACALAILGLQSLPNATGTGKDIMAAIDTNPALVPHLNWEADQNGKIRWHSGVLCALSAEKSGVFQKTGKKQGGQIVWVLDSFKAQHELRRHADVPLNSQIVAGKPSSV